MPEYKAKRHTLINTIATELRKGFIEDSITIDSHKYRLRTLTEDEEVWADQFMRGNSPLTMITSRKAPRLAAALISIDDIAVADLFDYPDDMPDAYKKSLNENKTEKRYWLCLQVLYFLTDDSCRPFIVKLYDCLDALYNKRDEAMKEIPK